VNVGKQVRLESRHIFNIFYIYVSRSLFDSCNHLNISFMHGCGFGYGVMFSYSAIDSGGRHRGDYHHFYYFSTGHFGCRNYLCNCILFIFNNYQRINCNRSQQIRMQLIHHHPMTRCHLRHHCPIHCHPMSLGR
jgi:hypothetical protein